MPTSEATVGATRQLPILDGKLVKWAVIVAGLVPALLLLWDAEHGRLGVNDVNFAIRSTGMLGLVCMTLSLVITPLRRFTNWAPLISVRRNLGVYGFLYILAHFTIFFLYDREGSLASTYEEITQRVYLWFGFSSLVIMLPLALTSFDAMVTKLGPKRWKLLHRLAYVAVALGIVHFYLLVKADTSRPIAFAFVFGGLMLYRVVRHHLDLRVEVKTTKDKLAAAKKAGGSGKKKFWSGELRVARIFDETHNVKTFRMVPLDGGTLPFEAISGQYINLALVIDGKRVNRSYTIASSPTRHAYVEISVKRDGLASKFLHASMKEGDKIKVSAPAGKFYFAGHEAKRVILVAGGVGITPMMSVIRSLTDRCWPGDIYLIFAIRKREDVIFEHELGYLKMRYSNLHVKVTLSGDVDAATQPDGMWDGARGRVTRELIEEFIPTDHRRGTPVMLCGPEPQMQAARKLFVELGTPDADIHEEAFVSPPPAKDEAAADAAMAPPEAADGGEYALTFKRAGKTAAVAGLTVLEAAEEQEIAIPFECRSGICGQCKCKLVSGRVAMDVQDALTAGDRAKGLILACQARPVRDCEVDA